MLIEPEDLQRLLGLAQPPSTEPVTALGRTVELAVAGGRAVALVQRWPDDEATQTHLDVLEALSRTGYRCCPKPLGYAAGAVVETGPIALPAIAIELDPGDLRAVVRALADLHNLEVRAGRRWDETPDVIVPEEELPLFRLGFASQERDAAREAIRAAQTALRASPFGLCHGDATATNIEVGPAGVMLRNFTAAGHGPQLLDVAAFLGTSGAPLGERRLAAAAYAEMRGLDVETALRAIDEAGLLWSLGQLMQLPRSEILHMGDDAAISWLHVMAQRIATTMRESLSASPTAAAIRVALWPE